MAIQFYDKGALSSGFYGWRVVATIRGKRYQRYFTAHRPSSQIPKEVWLKYQETRARYYEARWMSRSAAVQYLDFINTNHSMTKPYRGVGCHGITIGIGPGNRCLTDQCYFTVNYRGRPVRVPITAERSLTPSWHRTVELWGERFGIRTKDIERKKEQVPSPDLFRNLRRYLNDVDRRHIPVTVLHHAYAENRDELEQMRVKLELKNEVDNNDLLSFHSQMQREIHQYLATG